MNHYNIVMIPNAVPVSGPKTLPRHEKRAFDCRISNLAHFIGKTAADPLNLKAFAILADLSQARGFLSGQPPLHFWSG
jgi:hypothetical protein